MKKKQRMSFNFDSNSSVVTPLYVAASGFAQYGTKAHVLSLIFNKFC